MLYDRDPMGFKLMSILAVTSVVIVAGCGGGKKSASSSPATTATSAVTTTTGATTTTAAPTFASTKNCAQLIGLGAKFAQALGAANAKGNITDEAKVFQAMAAAAPSDIRGDFQTLASAFSVYAQAFAKAGIKAGQAPTAAQVAQLQGAAKAFSASKLRAAEQHLAAWGHKNCGGLTTTTTG